MPINASTNTLKPPTPKVYIFLDRIAGDSDCRSRRSTGLPVPQLAGGAGRSQRMGQLAVAVGIGSGGDGGDLLEIGLGVTEQVVRPDSPLPRSLMIL